MFSIVPQGLLMAVLTGRHTFAEETTSHRNRTSDEQLLLARNESDHRTFPPLSPWEEKGVEGLRWKAGTVLVRCSNPFKPTPCCE